MASTPEGPLVSGWVRGLRERQHSLAKTLVEVAYGCHISDFHEVDPEVWGNYLQDAWDVLTKMPHLLDLEMRENLEALGLIKPGN